VNEIVLLALTRYFAHTDETPEQLTLLEHVGVGLMLAAIKPLGELLTTTSAATCCRTAPRRGPSSPSGCARPRASRDGLRAKASR
jgi:hypothetical protein